MLYRKIKGYIENFYETSGNALMLTGARQTCKTYSIRSFGKSFKNFIEINFIENSDAVEIFRDITSADEILLRLSALINIPLEEGKTLIFFDEVQCCENIVTAIKFLVDDGRFRYILSGSLLGVELKDIRSVPVGYMSIKEVFPLDFEEFVINLGISQSVLDKLRNFWDSRSEVDSVVHAKMMQLFRLYVVVGGMPAAVAEYISTSNLNNVLNVQRDIVTLYRMDISKYAQRDKLKIKEIFDLVPSELDAKNKRFILKRLNEHAKFERYQDNFLWLKDAGVVIPVYNVEEPKMPLKLSETRNLFKLFSNDVGLLASQYVDGIQLKVITGDPSVNYGSVFENVVAQELLCHGLTPYYYNNKKRGEIDFVISIGSSVLPIEVKSGKDYQRHSALSNLINDSPYEFTEALVLCNGNFENIGKIVYAPIYMIMFIQPQTEGIGIYKVDLSGLV